MRPTIRLSRGIALLLLAALVCPAASFGACCGGPGSSAGRGVAGMGRMGQSCCCRPAQADPAQPRVGRVSCCKVASAPRPAPLRTVPASYGASRSDVLVDVPAQAVPAALGFDASRTLPPASGLGKSPPQPLFLLNSTLRV